VAERQFKYEREDFGDLPVRLEHLTISLNFEGDEVEATNCLQMTAREPLYEVRLDAKDLHIERVEWLGDPEKGNEGAEPADHEYFRDESRLIVSLPRFVDEGERFSLKTVTRCVPSDNILEGIYKDVTPPGAPQQYISQCQQWGFQRIMPIFDDCRAKCTMTTTIEADAAYTHLISNGNISRSTNPRGVPVPKPGDPSRQIITYENPVPMAPYLFVVCVGTWDMLVDHVTYDSGRTVRLEYLVPPGRTEGAQIPMEILKRAVLWIGRTQDYQYVADTYRTICMTKSNFGGMENVGNTTIVTDAALIDEHTMDQSLIYAHAVIVHEFEHNQCGSETTMETPFDVWLNEAYTVHVERQFVADVFDPTFVRLNQVDSIRNPLLGPLAVEDSGRVGQIVRDGFNNPDELIDAVTYVKAAEVIRMLQSILGPEQFRAGKARYFSRYRDANANTDQFFECFEEVSGQTLDLFKKGWLYTAGYPRVTATTEYDPEAEEYRIRFRQELHSSDPQVASPRWPWWIGKDGRYRTLEPDEPLFHIPVDVALVDREGRTIPWTEKVFQLTEREATLIYESLPDPPAFASLNRDYSFYGTFVQEDATRETLLAQARLDTNPFNRVEAMRRLTDRERVKLLLDPDAEVDTQWLALYDEILSDAALPSALKAYFLRIDEQPMDRTYSTWYQELVLARERLMREVNNAYGYRLVKLFYRLDTYRKGGAPNDGIEERLLKNTVLGLIAIEDTRQSHRLIIEHFERASTAEDRVAALAALNRSSAQERREILENVYSEWHEHISGYANYLRVVASGTCDDVFDMIAEEQSRSTFDLNNPTLARSLLLPMASNNKKVWTGQGITWVADTVIMLASINDYTASRLLNTFQLCRKLKPALREKVSAALERIAEEVPDRVSPTIQGQARAYMGLQ
jgi:aminopeptidase N